MGEHSMLHKLTIAFLTSALALGPALAVDMPSYGSKNFDPPGDAPSYFTNENGGVAGRGPDTAAIDLSADETAGQIQSDVGSMQSVRTRGGRHSSHASSARHASGKSRSQRGSTHYAKSMAAKSTNVASLRQIGGASKKSGAGSAKGAAGNVTAVSAKTRTAKPAKANLRHAAETTTTASRTAQS